MIHDKRVVLLFSGGMDSTALLWQLLSYKNQVLPINVNYQQRHYAQESKAAKRLVKKANAFFHCNMQLTTLTVNFAGALSNNALTNQDMSVPLAEYTESSLSGTVVPGRNATFLSMAFGVAYANGYDTVATAVHGGDHAIYPDCRPEFVERMREVYQCMIDPTDTIHLYAPYLYMSKMDIAVAGLMCHAPLSLSYSCYNGLETPCMECATCRERINALDAARFHLYSIGRL